MFRGTIRKFVSARAFGFILDDSGSEHFFHITGLDVQFTPREGMRVEFDIGHDQKSNREQAHKIKPVQMSAGAGAAIDLVEIDNDLIMKSG